MNGIRIEKNAVLSADEITESTIAKINRFSMKPLTAEQVFTFKAVLCDTHIDRDSECFSDAALLSLKDLFVGKTVVKDHKPCADNQIARIYDTELTPNGSDTELTAYCYMVRTDGNAGLIAEIEGGIKKEGSVSCAVTKRVCSICGKDSLHTPCRHIGGMKYDGAVCHYVLDSVQDAYEFSLVGVPAQTGAGIRKSADIPDETQEVTALLLKAAAYRAKYKIAKGEIQS